MEQAIFKKARLAAAIALVSGTTLLTGCFEGDKSTTNSTTVQQDASRISVTDQATPRAEILGIVQDTNGNPVAGATVSIGAASTKTDANGAYAITGVPVTGFTGNAGTAPAQPIQISVVPASSTDGVNYLSATVSVTPQASTIIQTVDGDHSNTEDALLAIITTDGLAVSAGVTVVPALQSSVAGVLRNYTTGETIANAVIGLEVLSVNEVDQQQVQNAGVGTSYGVGIYQVATDSEGRFSFTNLPVDTDFDIAINGWLVEDLIDGNSGDTNGGIFATTPEVTVQNIGTLRASEITSQDDKKPFVTSVTGVVVNQATGLLNDDLDGTQGLTIHFSEPLQALVDSNSVFVYNETAKAAVALQGTPALSADGRSLTITTATPIPENNVFSIYLIKADFQDLADNHLQALAANPDFRGEETPWYDEEVGVTTAGSVKLTLKTFADPVTVAGAVVDLKQLLTDGGFSEFEVLQTLNSTFLDVDTGSLRTGDVDIEQLNEPEAALRLKNLSDRTYAEAELSGDEPGNVVTNVARIQFTIDATTQSANYILTLKNAIGVAQNLTLTASDMVGTLTDNGTDEVVLTLDPGFEGTVDMLVQAVQPGWTLTVSSITDFGSVDGVASVVLTDQIAPTTVLQSSYGAGDDTATIVTPDYGNGGELSNVGSNAMGAPLLNITPRLLVPQVENGQSLPVALPVDSIWDALMAGVDRDANHNRRVSDAGLGALNIALYDTAAWTSWNTTGDRSREVGIAFSEDISLSGTPAFNGTANRLSGWAAHNDVVRNDLGNGIISADLANVKVNDIMALANTDNGKIIDFTGVVADASGNTATAANNAKVVVRDMMPPMLTSAVYDGENIVLNYNENVSVVDGSDFVLYGSAISKTITVNTDDVTVAGTSVTIPRSVFGDIDSEALFNRGTYDQDGVPATADAAHGAILTADTEDTMGTSWNNWNDGGVLPADAVDLPAIVIRDAAGVFETSTPAPVGFTNGAAGFTVTYRFSHRIDLQNSFGAASVASMTGTEVAGAFTLTSAATINPTGTSAVLDSSGRVLTVTVALTGAVASTDKFGLSGGTIRSEWDINDPLITTLAEVTAP